MRLAERTGAKVAVVELFAFLHDSKRVSNSRDPEHGARAAAFARSLRGTLITLDAADFELLAYACAYHTAGLTEADVTVQTCWDADRLDLGRCDIIPQPDRLCTGAAKDPAMIQWAVQQSMATPYVHEDR
ncbi:MAG: hypothetical protein JXB47_04480 [Anaerolineae bacterium]|nr:hypothetical protein [Anaerolineae bacterium]